jgi:hypothetical protein
MIEHDFTPDGKPQTFKVNVKPKKKTYHSGANDERSSILAKVRRMVKTQPSDTEVLISGTDLIRWLLQRNERYRKNPGGL